MTPKISVAICTFNGAEHLMNQLDSIANQTLPPNEIIISDDCSSDDTLQVSNMFKLTSGIDVGVFSNTNRLGVVKNFERAMALCSGDYIFLCDQDDYWLPKKIEVMAGILNRSENVGLLFSNAFVVNNNLEDMGYTVWDTYGLKPNHFASLSRTMAMKYLINNYSVTGCTVAFRASYLDKVLPIPQSCMHDAWLAYIIGCYADVQPASLCLVKYRQHSGNVVGGRSRTLSESISLSKSTSHHKYDLEIETFRELHKRYLAYNDSQVAEDCREFIANKINHLVARRQMYFQPFLNRIVPIIFELLSLRYFIYSRGILSAIVDAAFRVKNK